MSKVDKTIACKRCGHDMSCSRARTIRLANGATFYGTTCGKCRQVHQIFFKALLPARFAIDAVTT
jgi:transcription elongation factor Elf1